METNTQSPQFLRKRKFLIVLPLLVLPFLTLLFWALGGGSTGGVQGQEIGSQQGLNMELPNANLKEDKPLDKLSYYEKAASDSAKLEELMKNDPYYLQKSNRETSGLIVNDSFPNTVAYKPKRTYATSNLNTSPYRAHAYEDPNEAKVYKKLEQLNAAMNQAGVQSGQAPTAHAGTLRYGSTSMNSSDIDRLEQMMSVNKQDDSNRDPEMQQLNGMMDKILDIQHPERIKDKIQQTSEANKGQVFAVNVEATNDFNSLLTNNKIVSPNELSNSHFYSLDDDTDVTKNWENAITAVVDQSQVIVDGSIVKLRLLTDVYINGRLIPKDNFVFGIASLNGERLQVKINSIRYNNSLFPVDLSVYDIDGMDGIYIPGAITRDVAKQSVDRAIQGIGLTTLDPSFKAQAATAGMEAAKTLVSKKAKLIKVMVKAGYQVLLRDEKQKTTF